MVIELLSQAQAAGLVLSADGDRLKYEGKRTPEVMALLQEIAQVKADVIAHLTQPASTFTLDFAPTPPATDADDPFDYEPTTGDLYRFVGVILWPEELDALCQRCAAQGLDVQAKEDGEGWRVKRILPMGAVLWKGKHGHYVIG